MNNAKTIQDFFSNIKPGYVIKFNNIPRECNAYLLYTLFLLALHNTSCLLPVNKQTGLTLWKKTTETCDDSEMMKFVSFTKPESWILLIQVFYHDCHLHGYLHEIVNRIF